MATPRSAFHRSPLPQLTLCSASEGVGQWTRIVMGRDSIPFHGLSLRLQLSETEILKRPACNLDVRSAHKSVMRVLQELGSASGTSASAKLLVRRSRSLSRAAQMEVLELLVHRGQCELVLPLYEAVRKGARYKWDARLHARIVAMVSNNIQTLANSSHILEPQDFLSTKQKAELECALIESYISQDLVDLAHEALHRLCELPLANSHALGYRALVRAYSAAEKPAVAEKLLMSLTARGCPPSVDDYKVLLLGFGKLGMLTDMERVADALREKGLKLDTAGFNIRISACCYAGNLDRMVEIFLEMKESGVRPSLVSWNALTKACRTLAAVDSGALASPQSLRSRLQVRGAPPEELNIVQFLLSLGLPSECVTFSSDVWQLDLHRMSVGTASIVVPLWLSTLRDRLHQNEGFPVEIRIVTGWGKHSQADVRAPVRKVIGAELEALKSPFKADTENRGAFVARGSSLKKWFSILPC